MKKQDYINVVKKEFKGEARKVMLEQIEEYYRISQMTFKLPKYKVGDLVKLPKNTYLNGFGSDLKMVDIYAKKGLVNAIIGFVLIFVLLIMLTIGTQVLTDWWSNYDI